MVSVLIDSVSVFRTGDNPYKAMVNIINVFISLKAADKTQPMADMKEQNGPTGYVVHVDKKHSSKTRQSDCQQ